MKHINEQVVPWGGASPRPSGHGQKLNCLTHGEQRPALLKPAHRTLVEVVTGSARLKNNEDLGMG